MKRIILTGIITVLVSIGYGQEIASFDSNNSTGCSSIIYTDVNISTTGICRGSGINYKPGTNYNSRDWGLNTSLTSNDYIEWTITPNTGYKINLLSMDLSYSRSAQGPTATEVHLDNGSGFVSVFTDLAVNTTSENNNIDLSAFSALSGTITFRLFGYNASSTNGTLSIDEHTSANKGIIIYGSVSSNCGSTSTWDGTNWSSPLSSSVSAIINADYNTATNGSFTACSLTVNPNFKLTVKNSTYVEIGNDVVVDGDILVESQGAFVQNSDLSTVTISASGDITVEKLTPPLNAWYEYIYWSSPVSGETIGSALFDADPTRRFRFNAQNFLDATMETNNNDAAVAGQDDIDDNANDWQLVNTLTTMTPGVGYASTHDEIIFNSTPGGFPKILKYTFNGPFNNGEIKTPVYRNDTELNDNNWNFIGNPYPSAIDADLFLAANSNIDASTVTPYTMDGAIFLWSHNTAPSRTNNGNEDINFSDNDYALINGIGEVAGGDGLIPDRTIPSCQGFFVSYSNSGTVLNTVGDVQEGEIVFNNSMRVADLSSNDLFFKNSNKKTTSTNETNKLWINLTSDNGVFKQIAIAYVSGATDGYDGAYYDAEAMLSKTYRSSLYSLIKGVKNKRFSIQGKNLNNLNKKETISLGFYTSITQPTLYTLSIGKFQGDFISNNTIYLKDKLLHKYHDLSNSNYVFTSEEGEFNKRFEIVFGKKEPQNIDLNKNQVSIISLKNNEVNFKTSDDLIIKNVNIYDGLVGTKLYQFKGYSNSETYTLTKPNHSIYIAKIELSSGSTITKKIIIK